jgi:two-component system LytT family response regulator
MRNKTARRAPPDLRPGAWRYYAASLLGLYLLYTLALSATFGQGLGWALIDAIDPTAAIALTAPLLRILLLRVIFDLRPAVQTAVHVVATLLFAVLLYWLTQVIIGVAIARDLLKFAAPDFFAPAAAWQLVQGVALYAFIALSAYAEVLRARLDAAPAAAQPDPSAPLRLFVKQDEEFRPIDPARIILARGADDYVEIETAAGVHLVRMTLSALGEKLGARFIRVHRSCLVNVEHVGKAEPAGGGRMLLHLDNGALITTSRAGARLMRERIV